MTPHSREPSPSVAATPLSGQLLDGRYQVGRLLGAGGMSAVYLAHHIHMGRNCALKVLLPGRAAQPDAAARFEREAALAGRISHPHLCHVYDFGRTPDGLPWLAMEFLAGESLAAALTRGPMPPERVARIASGCAAGLAAAHEAGIIHRDLKPANVMLVPRDGTESAVVMDFGIAWSAEGAELTRDGLMVGTPEVMSPEQIAGDAVDGRSDQYQLALLVCRMLTGHLPFRGATTQETMVMRLTDRPARLQELLPGLAIGSALQGVLDRGLSRRPEERYPDIRDLAVALETALAPGTEAATEILARIPAPHQGGRSPLEPGGRIDPPDGRGWLLRLGIIGIAIAIGLVIFRPWQTGVTAIPPMPPPTLPSAAAGTDPPVGAVPPAPVSPGPVATPPTLPSEEAINSLDPAVRQQARQQADSVYRSPLVPDSDRAMAAFMVAQVLLREELFATAKQWLENCLALGERAMCRRLLNTLP